VEKNRDCKNLGDDVDHLPNSISGEIMEEALKAFSEPASHIRELQGKQVRVFHANQGIFSLIMRRGLILRHISHARNRFRSEGLEREMLKRPIAPAGLS
jgi:hypothetical protein